MLEPKDLSIRQLKEFHKSTREKIECAKEDTSTDSRLMRVLNPEYNQVKSEGMVILRMLDKEFERRGYDVKKLFKGYKCN